MSRPTRSKLWLALQIAFAAALVAYAVRSLMEGWDTASAELAAVRPSWGPIAASSALVMITYFVLVQTWRVMLAAWDAHLSFADAARIWFVSNLGRYVPGKVWQLAAMVAMARGRGVSPMAATGSTLVVNFASVASGFAVVLLTGAGVLRLATSRGPELALLLLAIAVGGLLAMPYALPRFARTIARFTGRDLALPPVPARAIWAAAGGTVAAWVLYGAAFAAFSRALLPDPEPFSAGEALAYVAVYTGSYLAGYLALLVPGGIGVRESMLVAAMPALGLATAPQALVVAVASRLWLTALEVMPGLLFLAHGVTRRSSQDRDDAAS